MAKDIYHDLVKSALEQEGWTITADPMQLYFGKKRARNRVKILEHFLTKLYILGTIRCKCISFEKRT